MRKKRHNKKRESKLYCSSSRAPPSAAAPKFCYSQPAAAATWGRSLGRAALGAVRVWCGAARRHFRPTSGLAGDWKIGCQQMEKIYECAYFLVLS